MLKIIFKRTFLFLIIVFVLIFLVKVINLQFVKYNEPSFLKDKKILTVYYSHGNTAFDEFGDSYDEYMPVEVEFFARVLDIMPQIRESVYTLLPTKILCKEDCAGLCPECGADLNLGKCSCVKQIADPRLESLRNFVIE